MNRSSKLSYLAIPLILAATFSLVYFGILAPGIIPSFWKQPIINQPFVDAKLKYQFVTLAIALIVLTVTALVSKQNAKTFYRLGTLNAVAQPVKWLGIKPTDTWKTIGLNFAVIVSLVTGIFIYLNVAREQTLQSEHIRYLPFILLLSLMNAFTEEAITRLGLVTALHGQVPASIIPVASALLFAIPHYFGVPGGVIGSLMAGFLGWLLAKSILETKGFFWAWFLHFLQDVIIFTGLFLVAL